MNRLKDLSQSDLAKALNITQRNYSYLETDQTPLSQKMLIKFAKYYGVSTDYILYLT